MQERAMIEEVEEETKYERDAFFFSIAGRSIGGGTRGYRIGCGRRHGDSCGGFSTAIRTEADAVVEGLAAVLAKHNNSGLREAPVP